MSNNEKKRANSWFSNFNPSKGVSEENNTQMQENVDNTKSKEGLEIMNESKEKDMQNNNILLSKDKQDKIVLDLIVSLENMIKDRELLLYKNKDLDSQLFNSNDAISHMKQDLVKNEQLLMEKNKQILALKNNLTHKQMTYDQLLEDYKEYQSSSSSAYEKISIKLDSEVKKYDKLNEELKNSQYQTMLQINKLEENVRNLQIENKQYEQQYKKVFDEKNELLNTINTFTEQMSFSLSPRVSATSTDTE